MSDVAVRVEGISKRYMVGGPKASYGTLRDTIAARAHAPIHRLRGQSKKATAEYWALRDVSFEVKHGEVLGVIGRNGAGKSTLLKILSRITEPTLGRAQVYGRVGSLLEVGTGFHPELTGRENVYLNGAVLGMSKRDIDQRFDEIVEFSGVEQFLDTPVKRYSSGMYTRLAFSVAAHLEPEVLIVDEVLSVGDAEFQKKSLGKMSEVAHEGRTVLYVSHNMSSLINLCDLGILLRSGEVAKTGRMRSVIDEYMEPERSVLKGDLDFWHERVGKGRFRFARVWLENETGASIDRAVSGEVLVVALQYRCNHDANRDRYRVSVGVETALGQRLFICSTEIAHREMPTLPESGTLRCCIPRLPLSQGHYYLTLFAELSGQTEDWLQAAVPVDVIDGDFFGSGRQYPVGGEGRAVLVPHEWCVS
jgi:lipopolysaccharide transport system ATP-binding protein